MTINELIKKVFKDSGLTYDEISQKTGYSRSTLHGYASGRSPKVPLSVIRKLTEVFDVPVEYWLSADYVSSSPIKEDVSDDTFGEIHSQEKKTLKENIENGEETPKNKLMSELLQLTEWYHLGMFTKEEYETGKKFLLKMMEE